MTSRPTKLPETARSRDEIVAALQQQVRLIETSRQKADDTISTGYDRFDRFLPTGGFVPGTLVEWLGVGPGSGACTLAMIVARQACNRELLGPAAGTLVIVDSDNRFYPPAAAALGIDLARTVVVSPRQDRDRNWALDQALRCPGVTAVVAWPDKLPGKTFRRLQLAAESGLTLGLLVRDDSALAEPSWAELRLVVRPRPSISQALGRDATVRGAGRSPPVSSSAVQERRLEIELAKCRLGKSGATLEIAIHEETGQLHEPNSLPVAAQLARRSAASRSARA